MTFNHPMNLSTDFDPKIYYYARNNKFTRKNSHDFLKLSYAEMIFKMLESCGLCSLDTSPTLHTGKWRLLPDRETLFGIARSFISAYSLMIDNHLEAKYKKESITANKFLGVCLSRCSLNANFSKKGIYLNRNSLINSLCIAKCIFTPRHFAILKYCIPVEIWQEVEFVFYKE